MKKIFSMVLSVFLLGLLLVQSVFAFSDVNGNERTAVDALNKLGIVHGISADEFAPQQNLTYAQAVVMLARAFGWSAAGSQPDASTVFAHVQDSDWYANSFMEAHQHGLNLQADTVPGDAVSRERFADLLAQAIDTKGTFVVNKMAVRLADEDQINSNYAGNVHRLIAYNNVVELGADRMFHPKADITRGDAAVWVYNALQFIDQRLALQSDIKIDVVAVTPQVNEIILSQPQHADQAYSIQIVSIDFQQQNHTALIHYKLMPPVPDAAPGKMTVVPKAVTYIDSAYKPIAQAQ